MADELPAGFKLRERPEPANELPEGFVLRQPQRQYDAADVLPRAASNFIPSVIENVKKIGEGLYDAAASPVQTAQTVGNLLATTSPFMPDWRGLSQYVMPHLSPEARQTLTSILDRVYAPREALTKDYADAYGGWENIKRTVAEDPARVLLDVSTIGTGGNLAAARAPGMVGKAAKVAGTVADYTDPVSLTGKAAGVAGKGVTEGLGVSTGAGAAPLKEAMRAGREGGEAGINFRRAIQEGVPVEEVVDLARQGVDNMKREAQQVYNVRKNDPKYGWANDATELDFAPITDAWQKLVDSYTTKSGMRVVGDPEWNKIQEVGTIVAEWEKNPALRTVDDFDGLKRRIQAIYPDGEQPQVRRAVTAMSKAVGDQIKKQAPGYARAMKDYSQAMDQLWEMERAFALGDRASMQTAMSKLQSVMRNNANTQYGLRAQKLSELEEAGNVDIAPYLAGSALSSWAPRGINRGVIGGGLPLGAMMATGAASLPALVAGGAGLATTSPRLVGNIYHAMGRAAGLPTRLSARAGLPMGYFSRALSRPGRQGALLLERAEEEPPPQGYFAR
ncbi:MAG: hypothetical protein ACOY4R_27840 [Pseudomonadota bacterium]